MSYKYLMTGRSEGAPRLTFDRHESGFPVAQELMMMALDAAQVQKHLSGMASVTELKDRMVRQIVRDLEVPIQLQFALSQRLYYEALALAVSRVRPRRCSGSRNDPDCAVDRATSAQRRSIFWCIGRSMTPRSICRWSI